MSFSCDLSTFVGNHEYYETFFPIHDTVLRHVLRSADSTHCEC